MLEDNPLPLQLHIFIHLFFCMSNSKARLADTATKPSHASHLQIGEQLRFLFSKGGFHECIVFLNYALSKDL